MANLSGFSKPTGRLLMLGLLSATLAACSPAPAVTRINDPFETRNRVVHEANKSLDRAILSPAADVYDHAVPDFAIQGIDNFANNLALPGMVVNNMLQLNLPDAFANSFRFLMNSTIGIAGLFDPANANALYQRDTDFGETLHVWGVPEGAYLELPVLGPSTERDAFGTVVDYFLDPVGVIIPAPEKYAVTGAKVLETIGDRGQYRGLVDSVLYESADSYTQSRLLYLQTRRRDLTGSLSEDDLEDPYAE